MPAFIFSLLFISGILIGSHYLFSSAVLTALIVLLIIILLLIYKKESFSLITIYFSCILIILFGIYKSNIDFFFKSENSISSFPDTKKNSNIKITGVISELPDIDTNRMRFILNSRKIISGNEYKDTIEVSGKVITEIRKNIYDKRNYKQPVIEAGDLITLTGKLSDAAEKRNPGEFDYRAYLRTNNIYKTLYAYGYENVSVISKDEISPVYSRAVFPLKKFVLETIDKNYSGDEAAFLKGLITGERSDISDDMKESFVNAGVMHLIAVSGLNVAYIIISVTLILSLLRFPEIIRIIITVGFLIFYCLFTGSSASILRASIMGILVLISLPLERKINFYNIIGISAMIILIYDSKQLFDAGFILSYSATLSMAVFLKKFESLFLNKFRDLNIKGKKITILVAALFFTSLSAQIGTIPVTANYFGKISLISLFANVVAVPLSNLSLAIGFLQMIIAAVSDHLSSVISETNNLLLYMQLVFIKWCASLEFAYIKVKDFHAADIACYYIILFILLSIREWRNIFFGFALCILIYSGRVIYDLDLSKKLRITFLDVGQGDCSLIQTPDNKIILIDCGRTSFISNSGERTIAPYLRRNGIERIDLLIITHLHLDHIGGLNYLLGNVQIGEIIESGQKFPSQFTNTMDSLISIKNIPRIVVRNGDYINDMKDLRFYFLFPGNDFIDNMGNTMGNNLNNGSVSFILKFRDNNFFFTGDIERESESFICSTYSGFLKADVLKVAHHGSITSTTIPFLLLSKPSYAVISCGINNKFNHPSDIILDRLEKSGATVFRTDLKGAFILESDGRSIEFLDWK